MSSTGVLEINGLSKYTLRRVRCRLRFKKGKLQNPRCAASSALVGWGPWQNSRRVETRFGPAWKVMTGSSSGYILVAPGLVHELHDRGYIPSLVAESKYGNVFVYEFEMRGGSYGDEAVLLMLDDTLRRAEYERWFPDKKQSYEEFVARLEELSERRRYA